MAKRAGVDQGKRKGVMPPPEKNSRGGGGGPAFRGGTPPPPYLVDVVHLLESNGRRGAARLQNPRRGNRVEKERNLRPVYERHELRHKHALLLGAHAHGERVAKIAHGPLAHARKAQVLTRRRT